MVKYEKDNSKRLVKIQGEMQGTTFNNYVFVNFDNKNTIIEMLCSLLLSYLYLYIYVGVN